MLYIAICGDICVVSQFKLQSCPLWNEWIHVPCVRLLVSDEVSL